MSDLLTFGTTGFDQFDDGGNEILEQTKNEIIDQLADVMADQAKHLKELIERRIEMARGGQNVTVGMEGQKVTIKPLSPSTVSSKGHSKPLIDDKILLSSISVKEINELKFRVGAMSNQTKNGLPVKKYAVIQEFGAPDKNIPPRPFLRPAFVDFMTSFKNAVKSRIDGVSSFTIESR